MWLLSSDPSLSRWAFAAFSEYIFHYKFLIGPILLLHASGFFYVGITSVVHDNRSKRLQT